MDKTLFKRATLVIVITLVLAYVIYLFAGFFINPMQMEYASYLKVTDTINTTGFIVRNESYIKNNSNGVVLYQLKDGEKVKKNGLVAKVFNNEEDSVSYQKISEIDENIKHLKSLNKINEKSTSNYGFINNQTTLKLEELILQLNNKQYLETDKYVNDLLFSINEKEVLTGNTKNFDKEINDLEKEKEVLSAGRDSIGEIKSDKAGHFVSSVDGYENSFKYDEIEKINSKDLKAVSKNPIPNNTIGKVFTDLNWYIICPVTANEAITLAGKKDAVTIDMPFASTESILADVVAVNQEKKQDDGVVILKCKDINDTFSNLREEIIDIGIRSYEGIRVSKQALKDDYITYNLTNKDGNYILDENDNIKTKSEKVQGVYVLHGNKIVFKQVSIIYSGKDYVICNPEPEKGALLKEDTIKLHDQIILEGREVYDGKIVDRH